MQGKKVQNVKVKSIQKTPFGSLFELVISAPFFALKKPMNQISMGTYAIKRLFVCFSHRSARSGCTGRGEVASLGVIGLHSSGAGCFIRRDQVALGGCF